jgi:7-cyano-7-deazaguanine synthase in queuosine biosynthesis
VAASGAKTKAEPGVKSVSSPIVKREKPCIYHIANKLHLKDPSNTLYKYPRGVTACLYRHVALNKIERDYRTRQ